MFFLLNGKSCKTGSRSSQVDSVCRLAYGDGDEIEDMGGDDPALSEQRPTTTLPASHKKMIHSGTLYMAKVLTHYYISHATTPGSRVQRSTSARLVLIMCQQIPNLRVGILR
jgi:hypothetical protein